MPTLTVLITLCIASLIGGRAHAAAVIPVATLTQAAPGGGIYAGPGFLGRPAAAGIGWVAFRSLLAPTGFVEELVLVNMAPSRSTRISVARTGQEIDPVLGSIGGFLGNAAVDETGRVVFLATLKPPSPPAPEDPTPAAVLEFDPGPGTLTILAAAGSPTPFGKLALAEGPGGETPSLDDRTPSLAADGSVAFAAMGIEEGAQTPAIFLLREGTLDVVAAAGDAVPGGTLARLGPPDAGAPGHVAFQATLAGSPPSEAVLLWRDGEFTRVAGSGDTVTTIEPTEAVQELTSFAPVVDLATDDTIAFLGGPLADLTTGETPTAFGVLVWRGAGIQLLAYPGQSFGDRGRVTDMTLLGQAGGALVPPRLLPDGSVVFHAELNGGSSGVLARANVEGETPIEIATSGGSSPTPTPIGGTFAAFTAPPTIDGDGVLVTVAQIDGGPTSHALLRGLDAIEARAIVVGEPSPGQNGLLAGPPFSNPRLTSTGDVVFQSILAAGPSPVGLFRWRRGETIPLVRTGDAAPVDGGLPFVSIVGAQDVNDAGTVVFAAFVAENGRGIYAVDDTGTHAVAVDGTEVRLATGATATLTTVLPNPSIAEDGTIAFRGRALVDDNGAQRQKDGVFLESGGTISARVLEDDPAGADAIFELFREVAAASGGTVAFIADVTNGATVRRGLFVAEAAGVLPIVVEGDRIGDEVTGFVGPPDINERGTVAQLVRLQGPDGERAALVRGRPGRLDVIAQVGAVASGGGVYRSLGRPSINAADDVAFRATFEAGTGGVPGVVVTTGAGMESLVANGDPGPASLGGRFVSFGQRVALSDSRAVAFLAALAGGTAKDGVFLAEPTKLTIPRLRLKIGRDSTPDRLVLKFRVSSDNATKAINPAASRIQVSLEDNNGLQWSETVAPGDLLRRRQGYIYSRKPEVSKFKLAVTRGGTLVGTVRAAPTLTQGGLTSVSPPVSLEVKIGDVSGRAVVNCLTTRRRVRCR